MKIKKDELKELQDRVSNINQAKLRLGTLETQKVVIAQAIINLQRQLEEFHQKMDVLYGKGDKLNIDVNSGEYQKIEEDETNKKN
jgi:hypothetical protein|tara:strand:- start:1438 stop:1692 length:255 start_codon:yes stop_codon:yes gene_type:complete